MMEKEPSSCRVRILSGKAAWRGDRGYDKAMYAQGVEGRRVKVTQTRAAGAGPGLRDAGVCKDQAPSGGALGVPVLLPPPIKLSSWLHFLAYGPHCRQY